MAHVNAIALARRSLQATRRGTQLLAACVPAFGCLQASRKGGGGIAAAAARLLMWSLLCVLLASPAAHTLAQSAQQTLERDIKAALLFKFPGYVEWSPSAFENAEAPYVFGVVHADALAAELQEIAAMRPIKGRPVVVKRLNTPDQLAGIHVLFVGKESAEQLSQWMRAASGSQILTVSETEGALAKGSMINFRVVDKRVRFEISLSAAERSGIQLSSRMLPVALSVQTVPP